MQKIWDLIDGIAKFLKSRFGYALTIGNARLAAYGVFLVGVYMTLVGMVSGIYLYMQAFMGMLGSAIIPFMPSSWVVSGGLTLWIGIKAYKLAMGYMEKTWQAWMNQNAM